MWGKITHFKIRFELKMPLKQKNKDFYPKKNSIINKYG